MTIFRNLKNTTLNGSTHSIIVSEGVFPVIMTLALSRSKQNSCVGYGMVFLGASVPIIALAVVNVVVSVVTKKNSIHRKLTKKCLDIHHLNFSQTSQDFLNYIFFDTIQFCNYHNIMDF